MSSLFLTLVVCFFAVALAGSSTFDEPSSGFQKQIDFTAPQFSYTEYRFDYKKGLFRWDFYGSVNITTEIIKSETEEHYTWVTSASNKKLKSCGVYDWNPKDVPVRWEATETEQSTYLPDLITAIVHILSLKKLETKDYFELPDCVPQSLGRSTQTGSNIGPLRGGGNGGAN